MAVSTTLREPVRERFLVLWEDAGHPFKVTEIMRQLQREFEIPEDVFRGPLYDWTRDLRPHTHR